MKDILRWAVNMLAQIHDYILQLNDSFEWYFNDKQLHFLIIGIAGILLYLVTHAIFKVLAKKSVSVISWIYTMTVMVVITFAIEIGQAATNTGNMEFQDIAMGLWGVIVMGLLYTGIKWSFRALRRLGRRNKTADGGGLSDERGKPQP